VRLQPEELNHGCAVYRAGRYNIAEDVKNLGMPPNNGALRNVSPACVSCHVASN